MEESAIKQLWQSYHSDMEKHLVVQQKNVEDITRLKVNSLLASMRPVKVFTLIVGLLWALPLAGILGSLYVYAYDRVSPFFLYSATFQVLLTMIAAGIYVYQLTLINQVDFAGPVVQLQERLAGLQVSTLWAARILFLQLPAWTTFYLTENTLQNAEPGWLLLQGIVTGLFTWGALWIFFNMNYGNRDKKWFKWIFGGREWAPLIHSMALLEEIGKLNQPCTNDHEQAYPS